MKTIEVQIQKLVRDAIQNARANGYALLGDITDIAEEMKDKDADLGEYPLGEIQSALTIVIEEDYDYQRRGEEMTGRCKKCCETGHSEDCDTNSKSIYNMDLHENLAVSGRSYQLITRVPGGWLYSTYSEGGKDIACVFVPFNDEFQSIEIVDYFQEK